MSEKDYREYTIAEYIQIGKQAVAMRRINQAIKNGTRTRLDKCELCNKKENTVAHHYLGYDRPFDVWWICRECNANLPYHNGEITKEQAKYRMLKRLDEKTKDKIYDYEKLCAICGQKSLVGKYAFCYEPWERKDFVCQYCMRDMFDE